MRGKHRRQMLVKDLPFWVSLIQQSWGLLCLILLLGCGLGGCIEKVERACDPALDNACAGSVVPSVCFEKRCYPKVCTPGQTRSCYKEKCVSAPNQSCEPAQRAKTKGVGECRDGQQRCIENGRAWSACLGQQGPVAEFCDGQDNDCDGQVDEGLKDCACQAQSIRNCQSWSKSLRVSDDGVCTTGFQRCLPSKQAPADSSLWRWGPCIGARGPQPAPSQLFKCELQDLSCESRSETFRSRACRCEMEGASRDCWPLAAPPKAGTPCRMGRQTCMKQPGQTLTWGPCREFVLPKSELSQGCNGKDDDCDGQIDNWPGTKSPLYRNCDRGGACAIEVCEQGTWGLCKVQEICKDQFDNDCDGKIDEAEDCSSP